MSDERLQQIAPFRWTGQRARACELVADDRLSDDEIAAEVGVAPRTLGYWKAHPDFQARVAERREAQRRAIEAKGIADKQNRIDAYNDLWGRLRTVVAERAEEMGGEIAGAGTGLLVRQAKIVKVFEVKDEGDDEGVPQKRARVVYEYAVDTGLLRELRALGEQAAKELGQWVDKVAPTDAQGDTLDLATLMQRAREHRERTGQGTSGDGNAQ